MKDYKEVETTSNKKPRSAVKTKNYRKSKKQIQTESNEQNDPYHEFLQTKS